MLSSSIISVPDTSTCKLIECDFLKDLSKKAQGYLKAADILLMCNSFSSSIIPEKVIHNTLKRVIQVLKPGTLVFFISSKEKSAYFHELDNYGSFLFGPVEVTLENMPYNEKIIQIVGVKPLCSGRSLFAVWQKSHEPNFQNETENNLTSLHLSTKLIQSKSDKLDVNSPTLGMSNLKGEFSSNRNISPIDSTASSSQFSSGSISSQIIEKKDKPFVSKNSIDFIEQINFSDTNTSTKSLNTFDSVMRKKYVSPPCGNGLQNEENNGNNIHYFMKTFENLIAKLEGYITSQESSKVFSVKRKQSCDQHHHQNMHETQCRCSVKPCQFIKNGVTCCHSEMCYIDTNVSNCNCSMNIVSNLHRDLPQKGPCIVIPIQNLSNESLVQILSIISQNTSSANKIASNLLPKKEES
ncbi:hypothetical protein HNY73_000282 [Argiope bruennichi]|uniref:Uncharacterized protein n=2 Tax=Argiope bruennichi TaxID=94029 RepID=A0A8T0G082_ARGBR|nr:hypothetical protein HNY73_000282 [Argiope bruennichi]